jgi:two-component sensor histidine kinase
VLVQVDLDSAPEAAAEARRAVEPMRPEIPRRAFSYLRIVISELVTNSVKFGPGAAISLTVELDEHGLIRGEVADGGDGRVELRESAAIENGGMGLRIVDIVTRRWGVHPETTSVWFELALEDEARVPAKR